MAGSWPVSIIPASIIRSVALETPWRGWRPDNTDRPSALMVMPSVQNIKDPNENFSAGSFCVARVWATGAVVSRETLPCGEQPRHKWLYRVQWCHNGCLLRSHCDMGPHTTASPTGSATTCSASAINVQERKSWCSCGNCTQESNCYLCKKGSLDRFCGQGSPFCMSWEPWARHIIVTVLLCRYGSFRMMSVAFWRSGLIGSAQFSDIFKWALLRFLHFCKNRRQALNER